MLFGFLFDIYYLPRINWLNWKRKYFISCASEVVKNAKKYHSIYGDHFALFHGSMRWNKFLLNKVYERLLLHLSRRFFGYWNIVALMKCENSQGMFYDCFNTDSAKALNTLLLCWGKIVCDPIEFENTLDLNTGVARLVREINLVKLCNCNLLYVFTPFIKCFWTTKHLLSVFFT